jgi:hypothetical protein
MKREEITQRAIAATARMLNTNPDAIKESNRFSHELVAADTRNLFGFPVA